MRSNSLDFSSFETMTTPTIFKKTERTHEENQERAYIAASRRTDRSLEARVQSARMASEIHKRRTGKSLRVTDDIVLKEEMYEEEDDDLPRSYRVLGHGLPASSTNISSRVGEYLSNRVAMSNMLAHTNNEWRLNEVNQRFAQAFPQHASFDTQRQESTALPATHLQQPHQPAPEPQHQQMSPPPPQQQQQMSPPPPQQHQHQQISPPPPRLQYQHHQPLLFQGAPYPPRPQPVPHQFQELPYPPGSLPPSHHFHSQQSLHSQQSSSSRLSATLHSPSSQHPTFLRQDSGIGLPMSPLNFDNSSQPDSPLGLGSSGSAFTSTLPPEARMMMDVVGMNARPEQSPQNWQGPDSSLNAPDIPRGLKTEEEEDDQVISPTGDTTDMSNPKWEPIQGIDDTNWNTYMNENAWAADNQ